MPVYKCPKCHFEIVRRYANNSTQCPNCRSWFKEEVKPPPEPVVEAKEPEVIEQPKVKKKPRPKTKKPKTKKTK